MHAEAELLARMRVLRVVVVVVAGAVDDEEVGVVGEGLPVLLELGNGAGLLVGIGLVVAPSLR